MCGCVAMQKFSGLSDLLLQGIEAGVVACLQVSTQSKLFSVLCCIFAGTDVWCRAARAARAEEHAAGGAVINEAVPQQCSCVHALG
jgi:hypothetical protein